MRILRINEGSNDEIKSWIIRNCKGIYNSNMDSHLEIREEGVYFKKDVTFKRFDLPLPFKIISIGGDVTIEGSEIEDLSFLPSVIEGDFLITDSNILSFSGFPKLIEGSLEINSCKGVESFEGLNIEVNRSIYLKSLSSIKELKAEGIKVNGPGIIINQLGISSLKGIPVSESIAYYHISEVNIRNLVGLPPKVIRLFVSKCPLTSIEGIPFVITGGSKELSISTKDGDRENVNKQLELYDDILNTNPPNPNESRADYIKRILEINPEFSSIIPNEEIPKDLGGHRLLKGFDLF